MRKKFYEQSLLKILNSDKNPSQTYRRIRDSALLAMSDLSLLASKLPDDQVYEIFNENTLGPLFASIFFLDKSEDELKIRQPNIKLASYLAESGVGICINEYKKWNKNTPESSKPTVEYLQRARSICNEIGYKFQIDYIENRIVREKNKLIFVWDNKTGWNSDKFKEYVVKQMGLSISNQLIYLELTDIKKINELYLIIWNNSASEKKEIGSMKITFSLFKEQGPLYNKDGTVLDDNDGTITFYNHQNKEIKNKKVEFLTIESGRALIEK